MRYHNLVLVLMCAAAAVATQQCDSGLCCDLKTGLFKEKGSKCGKPENECLVAMSTCSGFSAQCALTNAANKTPCSTGVCMYGKCVAEGAVAKKPKAKATSADTLSATVTSSVRVDATTKELQLKITAQLEKAKTLLLAITDKDEALTKALTAIETSLTLQNTENAEQLALASSKVSAQLAVAISNIKATTVEDNDELLEQILTNLSKASSNISAQKKNARATAAGRNLAAEEEEKAKLAAEKVNNLIEQGLPVITKAAINAADRIKALQQEKLAKLVAEQLVEEKKEKERAVDNEVARLIKKAKAARLNSLKMFEKEERNDKDSDNIKSAARAAIESDPEMKMRMFTSLTKELLDSNREKFVARDRKKLPNEEKYAEDFEKEHTVISRNERALVNSGFFGEKYGRVNITLPEVSSEEAASLTSVLFGTTGGVNFVAIALFGVAALLVVVIIFAVVKRVSGGSSDHKKDDDDDDAYENF